MKVLVVVPFLPFPLISGGHQGVFNGLSAIPNHVDVILTYPSYTEQDDNDEKHLVSSLNRDIRIIPYKNYHHARAERVLEAIYKLKYTIKRLIKGERTNQQTKAPYEEWLNQLMPRSEGFIEHINRIIQQEGIDTVQCEMLDTLSLILSLPQKVRTIFVHHELGFVRKEQNTYLQNEPLVGSANVEINKIVEVNLLNRYDKVVTVSSVDANKLIAAGVHTPIHASISVVNTPVGNITESHWSGILSFIGPEGHPSNKVGLFWFLDNCWEHLLQANPSYKLRVIGIWTEETRKNMSVRYKNIEFSGYVADLDSVIRDTVMIVPITIGSGIRMKILEACMAGVPVVTTSIGKEGLPLENETHCFVADTPSQFVDAIGRMAESSLRNRLILAAQNVVKDTYSMTALKKDREALY